MSIILRVASRVMTVLAGGWDGKLVGDAYRLQWSRAAWQLDELPVKGKKKLEQASLQSPNFTGAASFAMAENILMWAKIDKGDSVAEVKRKILDAHKEGLQMALDGKWGDREKAYAEGQNWIRKIQWYSRDVFYLDVDPEGIEPFSVEGKDFSVKVEWKNFTSYSPTSDLALSDPHYTLYEASSPTAARKMFKLLKADPKALKGVAWTDFSGWLNKNKIQYKSRHSNWS